MKTTTEIAAKFQSIGHPAETEIHDSAPMAVQIKRLADWMMRVKMTDSIAITFARTIDQLQTKTDQRRESLANMLDRMFDDADDESEPQGVDAASASDGTVTTESIPTLGEIHKIAVSNSEQRMSIVTPAARLANGPDMIAQLLASAKVSKPESDQFAAAERSDDQQSSARPAFGKKDS